MLNHNFYGHGKLLLSGEYFVLDGAKSLALPTTVGQSMKVSYRTSYQPTLKWSSVDPTGKQWFEAEFEFWKFSCLKGENDPKVEILQKILQQARKQNPHFLRDDLDISVETKLEFPIDWGLGSSSSLLYNIAQWAYVSPFELQTKTIGGSGYDIACAQSLGPIIYQREEGVPYWEHANFNPSFKNNIFFIYLGKKQDTKEGIELYKLRGHPSPEVVDRISSLTDAFMCVKTLQEFNAIVDEHEKLVSEHLKLSPVKEKMFPDFWGSIKSLGAWGGDFALVTSDRSPTETREYFMNKNISTFINYDELILNNKLS